jgi:cell division protein FtsI (penicillin-binding protein 3)
VAINKEQRKRALVVMGLLTFAFIAVFYRLADIMLLDHNWYLQKARGQQVIKEVNPVKRGTIYDRKGRELAVNLETESLFCNPAEISSAGEVAHTLASAIQTDEKALYARLVTNKRFSWIERKMETTQARQIKELKIKGVGLVQEMKRVYPKGNLASHVVGFVNLDNKGMEGVEGGYDSFLSSKEESKLVTRDAKGKRLSTGIHKEIRGNNVVLTIDEGLQYILEKNLDAAMKKWNAASATAIMMDPYTGEILALANRPTFDPSDLSSVDLNRVRNRAITDCYEPGSTFKVVVGIAALEEKKVTPSTLIDCSAGSVEVGGRRIKDDHRSGVVPFHVVIQKSSNVGTIKAALMLGKDKVYEYIKRFGFGDKTGIDLRGEIGGIVRPADRWSGMSIGAIAIGQEVAVTPLQIVRAYAAVANGGYLVTPHVVKDILDPAGNVIKSADYKPRRVISEKTAATFREILKSVTEQGGTAKQAAVQGNSVAGKTGTAQIFDHSTKRYSKSRYIASFVGFVPADNPRIAMVVVIKEPKGAIYGGVVAGPVFRDIADQALSYLTVPPDNAVERGMLVMAGRRDYR